VGGVVVHDQAHIEFGQDIGLDRVDLAQERQEFARAIAGKSPDDDLTRRYVEGSEPRQRAGPDVIVAEPHRQQARSSARIWLFSSTHSIRARSGGSR
jgi:hypothetical protein